MSCARKEVIILKRLQDENEQLKKQLVNSQKAIKSSEAIETLIAFVSKTKEPFLGQHDGNNPFAKKDRFACL